METTSNQTEQKESPDAKYINIALEYVKKKLEKGILSSNSKAFDFVFNYEVIGNYIFSIGYSKLISKGKEKDYTLGIYRMDCTSIYGEVLFTDGNVIDYDKMYTVEEVKKRTKDYFSHYHNILKEI